MSAELNIKKDQNQKIEKIQKINENSTIIQVKTLDDILHIVGGCLQNWM